MSKEQALVCLDYYLSGSKPDADLERASVLFLLKEIEAKIPGKSVELRIPPYGVISVIEGVVHRRGTPRAVVEMDPPTFVYLAFGINSWDELTTAGRILASGERSNLSSYFPLEQIKKG